MGGFFGVASKRDSMTDVFLAWTIIHTLAQKEPV